MGALPAASYWSNAARTEGEQKQTVEDILKGVKQVPGVGVSAQALVLSGDQITPADGASGDITIDTEASAASDNLAQIVLTNIPDGSVLRVRNANASRVVVVKHAAGGSGQLSLVTGGDFTLADPDRHWLELKRSGTTLKEIARFPDADLAPIISQAANYTQTLADRGQLIDFTATATYTMLSAATAGKGFSQSIKNSGVGIVTLSGTVDGVASLKLQAGDEMEVVSDGTNWKSHSRFISGGVVPAGAIWGLTLSRNGTDTANDIDNLAGEVSSNDVLAMNRVRMVLGALTKRLDATWVTGTNQGGRSVSLAIANGIWHVFAIRVAGVDDIGFDTSIAGANLIADHAATHIRRIGSVLREAAANTGVISDADVPGRAVSGIPLVKSPLVAISITSQAHGLVVVPTRVRAELVCLTAEGGYAVNDVLDLSSTGFLPDADNVSHTYGGFMIKKDATNLTVIIVNERFFIPRLDTAAAFLVTLANWKAVLTPEKVLA